MTAQSPSGSTSCTQSKLSCNDSLPSSLEFSQSSIPVDSIRRRLGLDFNVDDFNWISELGQGNGGVVSKLQHKLSGFFIAQKSFELDIRTTTRAQIIRELQILSECFSPLIVEYYGLSALDSSVKIHMEYMNVGGLNLLLPMVGRFPEPILIHIANAVIQGLLYLWQELHIIHRNLKPSNILINHMGCVKLSDFVVSLQLNGVSASAFVGMRTYLAPECLSGDAFQLPSDVWSFGLTLMELAIGHYPIPTVDPVDFVRAFAPDRESNLIEQWKSAINGEPLPILNGINNESMSLFELFAYIVEQPAPRLPAYCFSIEFIRFIHACLQKDPNDRLSIEILNKHWIPLLLNLKSHYNPSTQSDETIIVENISFRDYLQLIFTLNQTQAINAVALAVSEDLDTLFNESDLPANTDDSTDYCNHATCTTTNYPTVS